VGKPPTFLFEKARKRGRWTWRARLLLEAFQMYEDSLCGSCAQSAFHTLDVGNTRAFTAETVTCLGCNVRETFQEQHPKPPKGLRLYVANRMGQPGSEAPY
jgi:hypothetical protein